MMASKAPKHDFAPSWLKIPDQENLKPGGAKSSEHADAKSRGSSRSRDDYYYRYGPNGHADYYGAPLPRQRSFDNYYDDRTRGYSPSGGKFRHHSVDEDYYGSYGSGSSYGYYNGYYPSGGDKYGSPYRSQPSLYREGKFSGSRGYQMNGSYAAAGGYYDGYMYDYYQGDAGYYSNGYGGRSSRRGHDKQHRDRESTRGEEGAPLEEDFPSLNGESDNSAESKAGKTQNNGVWDGRPKIGAGKNSNSVYKVLVPNKGSGQGKKSGKSISEGVSSTNGVTILTSRAGTSSPDPFVPNYSKKEFGAKEGSPAIDILNTRLVTQPKTISDKKSDFLRALRQNNGADHGKANNGPPEEESHKNGNSLDEEEEGLRNGVEDLDLGRPILSSSLEAEQRLLREMGWTEGEGEEEELTEDEKREMEILSQQLKLRKEQQQQQQGVRSPRKALSPPQLVQPAVPSLEESSDSDDSDLDL